MLAACRQGHDANPNPNPSPNPDPSPDPDPNPNPHPDPDPNPNQGSGILAGFPVIGVKATLLDGAYHDVDSSVMAFEIAGRQAARQGLRAAGAKLMEPMMKVDVTTPEEHMGDIIGDVNSRRGMVIELAERGNMKVVRAKVPLANMFQYVSSLRSMSKGRASYSMELEDYEQVPPNVEKEIMSKYKGNTGDDDDE